MIYRVNVTNFKGDSLTLELSFPDKSGIIVEKISGIGAPDVTINSTNLSTYDGGVFNSARAQRRNIVFTLAPMEAPSVETNRLKIYRYFQPKKEVTLEFVTEHRTAQITGYVEKVEADIFSHKETLQISIVCVDPWFYERYYDEIGFYGVIPQFEFPFENNSLKQKLIEFGEIRQDTRAVLEYKGDVDVGFKITIHAYKEPGNFVRIYNVATQERMHIDLEKMAILTGKQFTKGEDIVISTKRGEKYVKLLRDGFYTSVIGCLSENSDWFELTSGDNVFSYIADGKESDVMLTFSYRNAYCGI